MRGKKFIVNGNFVKIRVILRNNMHDFPVEWICDPEFRQTRVKSVQKFLSDADPGEWQNNP